MVATLVGAVYRVSFEGISLLMELVISVTAFAAPGAKPGGEFSRYGPRRWWRRFTSGNSPSAITFGRFGSLTSVDSVYHSGKNKRIPQPAAQAMV